MVYNSNGAAATAGIGTYDITVGAVTGSTVANYTVVKNTAIKGLTVEKTPLTITAKSTSKNYGDAVTFAGTEFTASALNPGDSVTGVTLTSAGAEAAATVSGSPYAIVAKDATGVGLDNYTISFVDGSLAVNPIALTITANSTSKKYGDAITFDGTEFGASAMKNGDKVDTVTLTSAGAAATAGVTGSPYAIVPSAAVGSGLGNYTIGYVNGTLTVGKLAITVTPDAGQTKEYGDGDQTLTYKVVPVLVGTDVMSGNLSRMGGEAMGDYYIQRNNLGVKTTTNYNPTNYDLTFTDWVEFTITKATLTVTADNKSKDYGTADPGFTFKYGSFKYSEGAGVIDKAPTCTVTVSHDNVGTYPITCSGGADNNYEFKYVDGTLTVNGVGQTINFGTLAGKTLGDAPFTVSAAASSLLPVSFSSLTTDKCTVDPSTSMVTLVATGTCTIRASQGGDSNYNPAPNVDQSFTISAPLSSAKAITVFMIGSVSGTIDEGSHTIAVTVSSGTNVTSLTPTVTITGAAVDPASGAAQDFTNPVTYTVTAENASTQPYLVTVTVADPVIVPVTGVTLNEDSHELTVGNTDPLTATVAPANATNKSVTWRSSDPTKASVDASGLVTAVAEGSATITVTTVDGGYTDTDAITVKPNDPVVVRATGVSLNEDSHTLTVGNTDPLTATVSPADATDKSVTWLSSDPTKASVSASGLVTALAVGSATITVTTVDGGYTDTDAITIEAPVVKTGTIKIVKTTVGGNVTMNSFGFVVKDSNGHSVGSPTISLVGNNTDYTLVSSLNVGVYTVQENNIASNWNLASLICDNGSVANGIATVTVTDGQPIVCTFTNSYAKASQTITVTKHAPTTAAKNTSFGVAAKSSSNLAVAIGVTGNCSIVSGGSRTATVRMGNGTGACAINYTQAGNATYVAATPVTETTTLPKTSQRITITKHAPSRAVRNSSFGVAATASSGLAVTITASGNCSITSGGSGTSTVKMGSSLSSCRISYAQAGDTTYAAATTLSETTSISR